MSQKNDNLQGRKQGRPAGTQNKNTKAIKDMIEGALRDVGGQAYLARQAEENPSAFMGLIGKILPKDVQMSGPNGGSIPISEIRCSVVYPAHTETK